MRSDDDKVGLALSVLSHFKEPDTRGLAGGVKYASFDGRLFQFRGIAEPFTAGQACANDIRAAGTVWVRLIDRKNSNEPRIVPTPDSNLLAHRATDAGQASRISRAAFRIVLQRVLLGQAKLQDSRIVCSVRGRVHLRLLLVALML